MKRVDVADYAGEPLYPGDLITYGTRVRNRVRMTDACIAKTTVRLVGGRLRPMLLVEPTGDESGFVKRKRVKRQWVSTEHVRLILPGERA